MAASRFAAALALVLPLTAIACVPPDCDRVDEGSCVNACCKLAWEVTSVDDPLTFCRNVSALLASGGPDGRFARYDNEPVCQMWSHKGTYVVQGNHTTAKGTYVDLVQIAAERASNGLRVLGFSHSQDLIHGEFAWSDFGQNYKNLALIVKALGISYSEATLFGCPPAPPPPALTMASSRAAPPPLPAWTVAAWQRDFERHGATTSNSTSVYYVQASSLFSDCRVPKDRPAYLRNATSLADYSLAELQLLAKAHGFAGGTSFAADTRDDGTTATTTHRLHGGGAGERAKGFVGNLTWHHVLTDYQNVCADASAAWPKWLNGTDTSRDIGAIEILDDKPGSRLLHEHGYPIDTPVVQYEQWRALTPQGDTDLQLVWPQSAPTPTAILLVVGSYFAYARDRPVHGDPDSPHGCSLSSVLARPDLTLEQKRKFADAELSFGRVTTGARAVLTITQSTLPFREGQTLGAAELCRPGGRLVGSDDDGLHRGGTTRFAVCA